MTNLQELFDATANRHGLTHFKHSDERRANISAGAKKRWANTSVRYTDIAGAARRKAIMTPQGLYPSRAAAFRDLGISDQKLDRWIKKFPDKFYYVDILNSKD
jgi:hypothetical protein